MKCETEITTGNPTALVANRQTEAETLTFPVVPVHDGKSEHATVAMHSEGNLDERGQVVQEKQGGPTVINTSHQYVHILGSLKVKGTPHSHQPVHTLGH